MSTTKLNTQYDPYLIFIFKIYALVLIARTSTAKRQKPSDIKPAKTAAAQWPLPAMHRM